VTSRILNIINNISLANVLNVMILFLKIFNRPSGMVNKLTFEIDILISIFHTANKF